MLWVQAYLGSPVLPTTPTVNLLNPIAWEESLTSEGGGADIVAFYNILTLGVYLKDTWSLSDPYDRGVLVHELVHVFQHQVPQRIYKCHALRENEAYIAQSAYLVSQGVDPHADSERRAVSRWILLLTSACSTDDW